MGEKITDSKNENISKRCITITRAQSSSLKHVSWVTID